MATPVPIPVLPDNDNGQIGHSSGFTAILFSLSHHRSPCGAGARARAVAFTPLTCPLTRHWMLAIIACCMPSHTETASMEMDPYRKDKEDEKEEEGEDEDGYDDEDGEDEDVSYGW